MLVDISMQDKDPAAQSSDAKSPPKNETRAKRRRKS